jgi:hypothetical protein
VEARVRLPVAVLAAGLALLGVAWWDGSRTHSPDAWLDATAREEATKAARLFAAMSAHLHASSGDARFAERLAADEPVIRELLADAAFVQQSGREEHSKLVEFRVVGLRAVGPDIAELRAREYWVTRSRGPAGEGVRSDVTPVRYALRREAGGWRVADWTIDLGGVDAEGKALP